MGEPLCENGWLPKIRGAKLVRIASQRGKRASESILRGHKRTIWIDVCKRPFGGEKGLQKVEVRCCEVR